MLVKIYRFTFKNLRNSEYTMFVSQLIAIFLKYQPELLHLKKSFERLTALMPLLEKVKVQEISNAISNKLRDLDNERDNLINAIINQARIFGKLSMPSVAPHVLVMERFWDKHGRDIASANYNSETNRIEKLLLDYDTKTDIKVAVEGLNLTMLFEQLRVVNTEFASQFLQRTKEDAAEDKVDAIAIRLESDKALIAFFDALIAFFDAFEFCSSEYEDLNYEAPAKEMNELISYYKTQLKARSTRRNAGKDVSTEKPIV